MSKACKFILPLILLTFFQALVATGLASAGFTEDFADGAAESDISVRRPAEGAKYWLRWI